jgi:hypothetical protein
VCGDNGILLEEVFEGAAPVDDTNDFDCVDSALVRVGAGLIKDEIRALDEKARGRAEIGTTDAEPGILNKELGFGLNSVEYTFRSREVVESDVGVNLDQVFTGLRRP